MKTKFTRIPGLLLTILMLLGLVLPQSISAATDGSLATATAPPFCSYRTHVQDIG